MKRWRTVLIFVAAVVLVVLVLAGTWIYRAGRVIGFVSGHEGYVELYDGRIFAECESEFGASDRGRLLGRLSSGGWLVFDVRGGEGEYIYIAALGRGEVLRLVENFND